MTISAIISFSTIDARLIRRCIEACQTFTADIFVIVCDHFFDGEAENYSLLEEIYHQNQQVTFLEYAFACDKLYGTAASLSSDHPEWAFHWHNTNRLIGSYFAEESDYLLFIDSDEIIDKKRFVDWLARFPYQEYVAMRFASYYYFRNASEQALQTPPAALLVQRAALSDLALLHPDERSGLFASLTGKKVGGMCDLSGLPMIHHYSWVRSNQELMRKVRSWGHRFERNWGVLLEQNPSKDFVRQYDYRSVAPFFDPLEIPVATPHSISLTEHRQHIASLKHVKRVDHQTFSRMELRRLCQK